MEKIRFGTDGWRAIIAREFTVENVNRVTAGVLRWLEQRKQLSDCKVVVGYDCRFGGKMFAGSVADQLAARGVKTFLSSGFVSTPMVSLGTVQHSADLGIIITASHNPPDYNGYKLKGPYGGPLLPEQVAEIEALIPDSAPALDPSSRSAEIISSDLETMYIKHVQKNFNLGLIRRSGMNLAYDAMFGAGQNVVKKILPSALCLHSEQNPSFLGTAPEPIAKNLGEMITLIKKLSKGPKRSRIACALATDGDADRIGLIDSKGNFVDSHHIILLLIHYLCKYKKMKGKVVVAFSVTPRIKKICDHYGLELQVVKIGFKYVCDIMLKEDVLLGGEESGGIAIKGHIPERDGIWIGLTLFEFMARSGKTLEELIDEVYEITGSFSFERIDLHLTEAVKDRIVENCKKNAYSAFGPYKIERLETIDGWKYHFGNDEWLMIRASGTEPVLRTYAESSSRKKALEILNTAGKILQRNND